MNASNSREFASQYACQTASIPQPKLMLLWLAKGVPRLASHAGLLQDDYRAQVAEHARSLNAYPVLEITTTDPQRCLHEVTAALSSMQ